MSPTVIRVEGLGKAYRLGQRVERSTRLRTALVSAAAEPLRRLGARLRGRKMDEGELFWALKDVNFEVAQGEVIGIIGRNGAGKSTLLKILSRITDPTEGRAELWGRVGSLLEVGTGFHRELSGRENIYLNGSILGMKRREIDAVFDQIVSFAGISRFLDTPVKRYSSGMYVRLAFAVAAHLEPEIVIVDEVLAVGDVEFQKKCLGKMGDVARSGRTVLFVSHNMDAVLGLCSQVIVMEDGRASPRLAPLEGVTRYLESGGAGEGPLINRPRYQYQSRANIFSRLEIRSDHGQDHIVPSGTGVSFTVEMVELHDVPRANLSVVLTNDRGQRVVLFGTHFHNGPSFGGSPRASVTCYVPSLPLTPGTYLVDLLLTNERHALERLEQAARLEIVFADLLGSGKTPSYKQGHVILPCQWRDLKTE